MSSFSHCPDCRQQVAIPDAADAAAQVRCPHCHAEFSLSDTLADRADGPPDVILVTPPPAETPLVAGPSAVTGPPAIEVSPETAQLEQEALELAEEASALQSRAEGLQVTVHTSDPAPVAAAAQAEALEEEAQALLAKVEAIADPVATPDRPTARPAMVAGTYRAAGGALVATADALDTVADAFQRKGVASQPEASEETPLDELESDLAEALEIGEHHDEKEDETIPLELPQPILEDEAPLPMSDAEPFFAAAEPAVTEPVGASPEPSCGAGVPPAQAAGTAAPQEGDQAAGTAAPQDGGVNLGQTPAPAEAAAVDASPLLLKAVNLRSKAEALRASGQDLLAKADALAVAAGAAGTELEAGEEGREAGEYAFHRDWAAAGLVGQTAGGSAGQSAGVAAAAGGTALPFPVTPRKQKKPKSVVRELVAILLGMGTAFVLSYLILNLVSDQYDWFGICPRWFPRIMKAETATPARGQEIVEGIQGRQAGAAEGGDLYVAGHARSGHPGGPCRPRETTGRQTGSAAKLAAAESRAVGFLVRRHRPHHAPRPRNTLPSAMVSPKPEGSEPKPPPAGGAKFGNVVDILKPPAYGSDDLRLALNSARVAFQGDLKPETYSRLCRLAEVLTFVDPQKGVTDLPGQKEAVEKLLRDVGERDKHKNVKAIAQLADKWLDDPDRDNEGILLAGRVQQIGKNGQGTTIAIVALAKPDPRTP